MPQTFHVGSRSLLVTSLSWLLMLAGVLGLLSPVGLLAQPLPAPHTPAWLPWLMMALVLLSGVALAGGVGLLQRLDWGRRLCIALLVIAIPLLGGAALVKLEWFSSMAPGMRVFVGAAILWLCGMLAWLAMRLRSSGVRQEFV